MRLLVVERLLVRTRLVVANNEVFLLQYIVRQVLLQSLAVSIIGCCWAPSPFSKIYIVDML